VYATARHFDDAEWELVSASLRDKGWLGADGTLTEEGREVKRHVESRTDELAGSAYASFSEEEATRFAEALRPLARAVVRSGEIPAKSPIGLEL
jgi:hypothetical protein